MAARLFASRTRKGTSAAAQWEKPNLTHEFKGHEGALWEEPILKHKFEGHEKEIWSFVFLHDNIHIVSGSADGTMRKWNCDTGRAVGKPWKGKGGSIYALALSPDGKMIASGSEDGGIQRWNTNGEMMEGVWMSHSDWVQSLSWSPSGSHIASGSENGTVLIQKAESGQVTMGPIETEQEGVCALAYSPSEKRIASGGYNATICIWNTKTGRLTVPSIRHLGQTVTSLVWSSDSTKLYSASDEFARVFNSKTGQLLHRFEHDNYLWSVALSPRNNVLACVGNVVQLWDTESHQPLSQPFHENHEILRCASFSWNGRYMAYGGYDNKLTLCTVEMDIASQLPALMLQQSDRRSTQQEIGSNSPMSPLSSCLDADATGNDGFIEEAHDDPYNNFFQSSHQSLPSPSHLPPLFSARRLWNIISRRRPPPDQSIPRERPRRGLFSHHARSNLSLELATAVSNQLVQEGKVVEGEGEDEQGEIVDDQRLSNTLGTTNTTSNQNTRISQHPTCKCTPTQNTAQFLALEF
ncbi:WD40-repeat-containing domain protein [Suillus occidentalis]|nr:WD40-repeat-containing domain protein [Suillus occidentalis]